MAEDFYILRLWNPALPGYISGDKIYVGTEGDIRAAVLAMQKDNGYADTQKAVTAFLTGDYTATHNIAYKEIPALEPVHFISDFKCSLGVTQWEHINTWGCPYNIRWESALVSQIVVRQRLKYYRCARIWFNKLEYESVATGKWTRLGDFIMGNSFLLDFIKRPNNSFTLNNILYVVQEEHAIRADAEQAMTCPDRLNFKPFFDEIFGDI